MADHIDSKGMEPYVLPLTRLLDELKPKKILEIGIGYDAYSTRIWLRDGNVHLTTVDKRDWGGMADTLAGHNPGRFTFIQGRSEVVLPELAGKRYDLIFIDGDHAYEGSKTDMLNAIPLLAPGGVIVLDDYGVARSAIDIEDATGRVLEGDFGVKQAADEVFTADKWEPCFTHLNFGNGGVAFKRKVANAPKSR